MPGSRGQFRENKLKEEKFVPHNGEEGNNETANRLKRRGAKLRSLRPFGYGSPASKYFI